MTLPTLYKRTSTGAIQTWQMEISGDRYRSHSGQMGGAIVTTEWTVAKPKNVGKANETTGEQQASVEVVAAYTKKRKEGYFEDIKDIDQKTFFKPMLAKSFDDYPIQCFKTETWYSQPKLDGIRCIVDAEGMWTRTGEPILTCPHIYDALRPLIRTGWSFDGEVYSDRLADDFNKLVSLAKKQKPTPEDMLAARAGLQYHVYDFPDVHGISDNPSFETRSMWLPEMFEKHSIDQSVIILVPTTLVRDHEHLDELYASYIEAGQEGQMLRLGSSPYENKRSKFLLKRKEFIDAEYEVVSIHEGVGNRSGMAGYVTLKLPDGRTFKATPKGTNADRTYMLKHADKFIGKEATVQHFKPTPDGIPRFPVLKAMHEQPRW